jgi:hypothetical protein
MRTLVTPSTIILLIVSSLTTAPLRAALAPTPVTVVASVIGYGLCMDAAELDGKVTWKEKWACRAILLDPLPGDLTKIETSFTFDPTRIQVDPTAFFFGDFSKSGDYLPLIAPVYDVFRDFEPVPDLSVFDPVGALSPRPGSKPIFDVDNDAGTAFLSIDLSANPIPADAPAQNFFGFNILSADGSDFGKIRYSATGNSDMSGFTLSCRVGVGSDPATCGSETPVASLDFTFVPIPSSLFLIATGLALLRFRPRLQRAILD